MYENAVIHPITFQAPFLLSDSHT